MAVLRRRKRRFVRENKPSAAVTVKSSRDVYASIAVF